MNSDNLIDTEVDPVSTAERTLNTTLSSLRVDLWKVEAPDSGEALLRQAMRRRMESVASGIRIRRWPLGLAASRIVNTKRTRMVRDSRGCTRIDHGLDPMRADDSSVRGGMVMIDDQVKQKSCRLEPTGRVTIELPRYSFNAAPTSGVDVTDGVTTVNGGVSARLVQKEAPTIITGNGGELFSTALRAATMAQGAMVNGDGVVNQVTHRQETLGEQRIEGVLAKGVRQVEIITAGAVDNEQPIESVMEIWTAGAIGLPVLFRHVGSANGRNHPPHDQPVT